MGGGFSVLHRAESDVLPGTSTAAAGNQCLMDELTPLQASVLSLVKQYVARQSLALEAMRELRPDIIARLENRVSSMTQEQWIELRLMNQRKSQIGVWG